MNRSNIFCFVMVTYIISIWLGVSYFGFGQKSSQYSEFFDQKIILQGFVVNDPEQAPFGQIKYEIVPEYKYSQKILVTSSAKSEVFYGDRVYLVGKLKQSKNFSDYDYVHYLQTKDIFAEISGAQVFVIAKTVHNPFIYSSLKVKHFVYEKFQKYLPREQSALLIALIVGQKDLLSDQTVIAFQITGVAHLIAVSGFILTLLLLFAEKFSIYIGEKKTWLICFLIGAVYIVMASFAAGVIRAAIMCAVYFISKKVHREYQIIPALIFTAAILITINPLIVKYDLGFALSFLSILGIVLFVPLLKIIFSVFPENYQIKEIVCTTIAAQIITVPLTAFYFKEISLIATITNLLVVPIVPLILWIGYLLCLPFLGRIVAVVVIMPLNYILIVVYSLAKINHASVSVSISANGMVGIYIAEIALYLLGLRLLAKDLEAEAFI